MLRTFLFFFGVSSSIAVDAVGICSFREPHDCLKKPGCAWLFLDGRCAELADAATSPPQCCAASSGACAHRTVEAGEGRCSVLEHHGTGSRPLLGARPATFDLDDAQRMAHFAGASYCSPARIRNWTCGVHCDALDGVDADSAEFIHNHTHWLGAVVAWDFQQELVVISFRGTVSTSIRDWLDDLSYGIVQPIAEYPEAAVHRGFWGAWQILKDPVAQALDDLLADHPGSPVRLTGHSLGAAIANCAAIDLKLGHGLRTSLIDFGSPRVGNLEFVKAMEQEVPQQWRITHAKDMVPHMPPQYFGFYHTPTEVFFPSQNGTDVTYSVCDGSGEDPLCSNQCYSSWTGCSSVADHMIYAGIAIGTDSCEGPTEAPFSDPDHEQVV